MTGNGNIIYITTMRAGEYLTKGETMKQYGVEINHGTKPGVRVLAEVWTKKKSAQDSLSKWSERAQAKVITIREEL